MARFTNHDEIAAVALELCEEVRELHPLATYRSLAVRCAREPEQMAQILMCLAAFVDPNETLSTLAARVEAIAAPRAVSA